MELANVATALQYLRIKEIRSEVFMKIQLLINKIVDQLIIDKIPRR